MKRMTIVFEVIAHGTSLTGLAYNSMLLYEWSSVQSHVGYVPRPQRKPCEHFSWVLKLFFIIPI